jgi:hypothetical protein
MPFQPGRGLPGERASRLGHLEVLESDLVRRLRESFEDPRPGPQPEQVAWAPLPVGGEPLRLIFAVDGSLQVLEDEAPPYKSLAFVKTALLKIDQNELSKIDKESPHPFALRDLLANAAQYHATVFPLRNVVVSGMSNYDAVRQTIFESLRDPSLEREVLETFKWLVYERWDGTEKSLPLFECPHCERTVATLPYNAEQGQCPACGGHLFVTDMLGFHLDMGADSAPNTIATTYMSVHETLLLFTGIRHFWEHNREMLRQSLFVKDGPLSIRAQYSKLVNPIRRFLTHARDHGYPICIIGQEKTGAFYDHLQLIGAAAPNGSFFIPGDKYVKEQIQHRPDRGAAYGKDTNYAAKVFVKLSDYHKMIINIPTGQFVVDPREWNLLGGERIFATLPTILSSRFEGALLPVELAHGLASLSTYPSAHILKIFSELKGVGTK